MKSSISLYAHVTARSLARSLSVAPALSLRTTTTTTTTTTATSSSLLVSSSAASSSPLSSLFISTRAQHSLSPTGPLYQQQQNNNNNNTSPNPNHSASPAQHHNTTTATTALEVAMQVNQLKRLHQQGATGSNRRQVEAEAWALLNSLQDDQINTAEGKAVALLLNAWAYFAKFWENGKDGPAGGSQAKENGEGK